MMEEYMPVVLDLGAMAVILGYLVHGWRQGLVRMLVQFVGSVLVLALSYGLSMAIASPTAALFRDRMADAVSHQMDAALGSGAEGLLGSLLAGIPASLQESLFGQSFSADALSQGSGLAEMITDTALVPVVEWLISCLLFLLFCGIGTGIVKRLCRKIHLERVFLIGFLNTGAGALVGVLQGLLVLLLLTCLGSLLLILSGDSWSLFNSRVVEASTLFRLIYTCNPFTLV